MREAFDGKPPADAAGGCFRAGVLQLRRWCSVPGFSSGNHLTRGRIDTRLRQMRPGTLGSQRVVALASAAERVRGHGCGDERSAVTSSAHCAHATSVPGQARRVVPGGFPGERDGVHAGACQARRPLCRGASSGIVT